MRGQGGKWFCHCLPHSQSCPQTTQTAVIQLHLLRDPLSVSGLPCLFLVQDRSGLWALNYISHYYRRIRGSSRRESLRKRKTRDFLQPKLKRKAYSALPHIPRKQWVPVTWIYSEKQRMRMPDHIRNLQILAKTSHTVGARYKEFWIGQRLRRNTEHMRWMVGPLHSAHRYLKRMLER
jgi:hypothetical protein